MQYFALQKIQEPPEAKQSLKNERKEATKLKQYVNVFTTTKKREDAEKVAQILVQKRLAGCVQIIGSIQSTYRWKNRKETIEEWLCLIKSEKSLYEELEKTLKEIHPYETPEITASPIIAGSKEYLDWLDHELKINSDDAPTNPSSNNPEKRSHMQPED
jgi:periplasmic divalent cation tolerance protein